MINLAISYLESGENEDRAIALLKGASDEGSATATFNLGVLAQSGQVDTPGAALDYFRKAAQEGEAEGYRAAAILLDEGRGTDRNPEEAARMLLRGATEDRGVIVRQLSTAADQWQRDTLTAVQRLLADAGVYTAPIDGLPGSNFTAALEKWRNGGFDATVVN